LGTELCTIATGRGHEVLACTRQELDVTSPGSVAELFDRARPQAVVQCAAYTAVDRAESEPEVAMAVNRDGMRIVAERAASIGAHVTCVSTDYVFDGWRRAPYPPDHRPNPISTYGRTKLEGELAALESSRRTLVVRTSWLYGAARRNFVTAMLERAERGEPLTIVDDERGGPSWSRNVARTLLELIERDATGVWHVADAGTCSRIELVREAIALAGLAADVTPVSADEWAAPAPRPAYSTLDVSATESFLQRTMPSWREALSAFLAEWRVSVPHRPQTSRSAT